MIGKRFLFILGRRPEPALAVREALDQAMTAAAFDQPVTILALDEGVLHMLRPEPGAADGVAPLFEALSLYDVEHILVERESLAERQLSERDLVTPVDLVDRDEVSALIAASGVVVSG